MAELKPQISICIPTYNGEKFIARTIQSVLDQTFPNFEIIVSDDGSTDKTLEIVRSFNDPRIVRVDSLSKVGAEANWNNSVANARADLVKLVCQDDLLYAQCLQTEFEAMSLSANLDVAFCFSLRDFVTPNDRFITGRRIANSDQKKLSKTQMLRKIVRSGGNPIGEPMAVMFRKSAFEKAGKFHGDYVIDLNMWAGLLEIGSALFIPRRLSAFRISKTSWTSSLKKSQLGSVRSLAEKIRRENNDSVSSVDLVRGQLVGLVRAPARQIASQIILLFDHFLGSAR
ncbi:MAG: glycosyltransferase family 2 protein [Acidimicrobiaceae bacterium]